MYQSGHFFMYNKTPLRAWLGEQIWEAHKSCGTVDIDIYIPSIHLFALRHFPMWSYSLTPSSII